MQKLNNFMIMWFAYPSPYNALDVAFSENNSPKTPEVTRNWIFNTIKNSCCIRLSHSLNSTVNHKVTTRGGVRTLVGSKGLYIYAVPDFSKYLKSKYGKPDFEWSQSSEIDEETFQNQLKDEMGIILFFDYIGGARGHADLWDRGKVGSYNLFGGNDRIEFWKVSY